LDLSWADSTVAADPDQGCLVLTPNPTPLRCFVLGPARCSALPRFVLWSHHRRHGRPQSWPSRLSLPHRGDPQSRGARPARAPSL